MRRVIAYIAKTLLIQRRVFLILVVNIIGKKEWQNEENMKTLTKAPFKADHVGSLLRPERLHNARKEV